MAEKQDAGDQGWNTSVLIQTTEEVARAAVAAALAIRPRPSIVVSAKQQNNSSSLQRWRRQLQRAWKNTWDVGKKYSFNPEVLTSQKRQWNELHSQVLERKQEQEPSCLFEHFVIVGLPPNANVEATETAFAKRKSWERELEKNGGGIRNQCRAPLPTLEPQVLFRYPRGKRLPMKSKDLPAFCFPGGVEAHLMERTPSMSELNEVVYGQDHQNRDDLSFVFLLKVADNATIYGICVNVQEIVQQPPGILAVNSSQSSPESPASRFLASAPRCYCILTKLPFFDLHFEVLNCIIAQERLDRITKFVNEMTLTEYVPPMVKVGSKTNGQVRSPSKDDPDRWMESAIPVNSVLGATAAAAGLIPETNLSSFGSNKSGTLSPEVLSVFGDSNSRSLEIPSSTKDDVQVLDQIFQGVSSFKGDIEAYPEEMAETSRDTADSMKNFLDDKRNCEETGLNQFQFRINTRQLQSGSGHERVESSESVYSAFDHSARSIDSDDDEVEDAHTLGQDDSFGADDVLSWAKAHGNDSLQIICTYHGLPVPERGASITFQPLEHLQPLMFQRLGEISSTLMGGRVLDPRMCRTRVEIAEARAAAMACEEAASLSIWTIATVCKALSLENVLALFAGTLLEKQMVVICQNLGVLSAVVLSVIPMIRPFEWQSLLLPILPDKMLDFLDAPVPFIVGVQHKTLEVRLKTSNLIRVNVYKDQVKMFSLPQLPRHKELVAAVEPFYSKLSEEGNMSTRRHPVHRFNDDQVKAAEGFLTVLRGYLESLCTNLRSHTITNVQSNNDKVSLLLKDSFIDSFSSRDRPFVKLFVNTQLFSVQTDAVLSSYQMD